MDKKTRDLIGENLIDIENTLKALNLDFLQTYSELDKTDSAETLFGEQFALSSSVENSSGSSKLRSSALNLYRPNYDFGGSFGSGKIDKGTAKSNVSPLEKQLQQQQNYNNSQMYTELIDKLDDKRSSTPDTGFASRETNLSSSRRSSQKSNYSPQETHFSPKEFNFPSTIDSRCYVQMRPDAVAGTTTSATSTGKSMVNSSSPVKNINTQNSPIGDYTTSRQRSMSFTDNYELKSPVLSEPQHRTGRKSSSNFCRRSPTSFRNKPRNAIVYKPRSIKARTLRRLSYNPIILDSSSSTSSESDFDHSIAHSECDIRTKMIVSSKRRRQYLNRKPASDEVVHDKLYGSNTSIKSAPHYNYANDRQSAQRYPTLGQQHFNYEIDYNEKIYDFGGRGPGNNYGANSLIKPPRAFAMNGNKATGAGSGGKKSVPAAGTSAYEREILYSEFDVSKLTGKSPTTQNFFHLTKEGYVDGGKLRLPPNSKGAAGPAPGFQWPEKIHASAIKQNDLLWRQQQANSAQSALFSSLKVKQAFSTDSSSTDTDEIEFCHGDFNPRIPPSPAP